MSGARVCAAVSPCELACRPRLLLRQRSSDDPSGTTIWERGILCAGPELKGIALTDEEVVRRRRGQCVLQRATRGKEYGAALAVRRRIPLEERHVEEVDLPAFNLGSMRRRGKLSVGHQGCSKRSILLQTY